MNEDVAPPATAVEDGLPVMYRARTAEAIMAIELGKLSKPILPM